MSETVMLAMVIVQGMLAGGFLLASRQPAVAPERRQRVRSDALAIALELEHAPRH